MNINENINPYQIIDLQSGKIVVSQTERVSAIELKTLKKLLQKMLEGFNLLSESVGTCSFDGRTHG
jgi:hypothetical protein